jgi:hypothetical protein
MSTLVGISIIRGKQMEKTISKKYLCREMLDLIYNINTFANPCILLYGGASLEEYAYFFELPERGITYQGLLQFLLRRRCIKVDTKENLITLDHESLFELGLKLRQKLFKPKSPKSLG